MLLLMTMVPNSGLQYRTLSLIFSSRPLTHSYNECLHSLILANSYSLKPLRRVLAPSMTETPVSSYRARVYLQMET